MELNKRVGVRSRSHASESLWPVHGRLTRFWRSVFSSLFHRPVTFLRHSPYHVTQRWRICLPSFWPSPNSSPGSSGHLCACRPVTLLGAVHHPGWPLTTRCGSPVLPTLLVHCLSFSRRIQAASSPWHHLDNFLVKIDLSLPNLLATFTMALTCRIMNSDQFNFSHSLLSTLLLEPPPFSTGWWLHWGILAQSHPLQSLF